MLKGVLTLLHLLHASLRILSKKATKRDFGSAIIHRMVLFHSLSLVKLSSYKKSGSSFLNLQKGQDDKSFLPFTTVIAL